MGFFIGLLDRYYELSLVDTLSAAFRNKIIVEFPSIFVALASEKKNFPLLSEV